MTRIVPNHFLSQRAILAVCTVLVHAGALAETIKNDYGEDLLVQTQLRETADSFHILIQVKGTKLKKTKDGKHTFSFDVAHLQRWISHIQPVLICVFDEATGKMFAFYPRDRFSSWYLATTDKKHLTIKLTEGDLFNETTARRFIWECRVEYFSRMLSWYENQFRYSDLYGGKETIKKRLMAEGNLIVTGFLKSLAIFGQDDQFDPKFRQKVENGSKSFAKHNATDPSDPLGLRHLFMLCFLAFSQDVTGVGLPGNLMENGTDLVGIFFKAFHSDEWLRAGQLVGDVSWLSGKTSSKRSKKS